MKGRKFAAAAAAALLAAGTSGQGVIAFGSEGTSETDQALALLEEIAQLESYTIGQTASVEADGVSLVLEMSAQKGAGGIGGVNMSMTVRELDPTSSFAYQMGLEDLFRTQEDACYLNVGELLDTVSEVSDIKSVRQLAKMVGLSEEWVRIPYGGLSALAGDDMTALAEDIKTKLCAAENLPMTAEAIDSGYRITLDMGTYVSGIDGMLGVLEENLEGWLDNGIAILKTADVFSYAQTYVDAALEGIYSVDPEFDASAVTETVDELRAQYMQALDIWSGAALMESLQAEGFDFDTAAQQLQEEWAQTGASAVMSYTVVKHEDGSYEISVEEAIEDGQDNGAVTETMTITPDSSVTVAAPDSYMELTDLVREASASVYALYEIGAVSDVMGGVVEEVEESTAVEVPTVVEPETQQELPTEAEETSAEASDTLQVQDGRFLVTSYGGRGCFVGWDDTILSLDMENSDSDLVFLDYEDADGYSNYVMLQLDDESISDAFAYEKDFYEEYYEIHEISDPVSTEANGLTFEYIVINYGDNEDSVYSTIMFGIDLEEGCCLYGSLDLWDGSAEDVLGLIFSGITSVQMN